ncbi:Mbov_0400 family ICE element protein [Metamycoplasma auris]|uniref:Uncharacterized protein n=1 Tax=Metamycoplasma auris TaxID=51363 RepID=A0A2W7G106_9BACT|nr:hypothetical protein [Metamycoplasma auris]PZV99896.1 hypothetical protein BCF89_10525 [Metamycoplasma auris]
MSRLLIGRVYKQRKEDSKLPIAKNRYGDDIIGHGINRPFLIFYSDDKVFYLSAKSITDKNINQTLNDRNNLILDVDFYGNNKKISIDCSVINVMDKELFEDNFKEDSELNDYLTSPQTYNTVMGKLFSNLRNISYYEIDCFGINKTYWKPQSEAIKNKDICEEIIITYKDIRWKYRDLIYKDENKFYLLIEEEFENIAKQNKNTNKLGDDEGLVL